MPKFAVTLDPSVWWAKHPSGQISTEMRDVEPVIVAADRCDVQHGALLFYGNDSSNVCTVLVAYARGTWKRVERVDG